MLLAGVADCQQRLSALFVGNSYTFFNSMPGLVAQIAESKGDTLDWCMRVGSAYAFERHWQDTSVDLLPLGAYNRIILQEWHVRTAYPAVDFDVNTRPYLDSLLAFYAENQPCARVFLYMPWGKEDGNTADCLTDPQVCTYEGIRERAFNNFLGLRTNYHLPVMPVSEIWDKVRHDYPAIDLYNAEDRHHPNLVGSYLAACVHYVGLFHRSPVGAYIPKEILAELGAVIQREVWEGLQEVGSVWGIDTDLAPNGGIEVSQLSASSFQLSVLVNQYDDFWWEFDDGAISFLPNPTVSYDDDCFHRVRLFVTNGCETSTYERVFHRSTALGVSAQVVHPTCSSLSDGSIKLYVGASVGQLHFLWSNGSNASFVDSVGAGRYSVTVSDGSACTYEQTFELRNRHQMDVDMVAKPSCQGSATGRLAVSVTGSDGLLTFLWSNGEQAKIVGNLMSGIYTVTVTDAIGCQATRSATVVSSDSCISSKILTIDSITTASARVNWALVGCGIGYRLEWRPADTEVWTAENLPISSGSWLLDSLQQHTLYRVRVRTRCGNGEISEAQMYSFRTLGQRFYDGDSDGYGVAELANFVDSTTPNYADIAGDCDDKDPHSYPNAPEICDQSDNDCNGMSDDAAELICPDTDVPKLTITGLSLKFEWEPIFCTQSYKFRIRKKGEAWQLFNVGLDTSIIVETFPESDTIEYSLAVLCESSQNHIWSKTGRSIVSPSPFVTISTNQWLDSSANIVCRGSITATAQRVSPKTGYFDVLKFVKHRKYVKQHK